MKTRRARRLRSILGRMKRRGASDLAIVLIGKRLTRHSKEMDRLFSELLHAAWMAHLAQVAHHDKTWGRLQGELDWVSEIERVKQEIYAKQRRVRI